MSLEKRCAADPILSATRFFWEHETEPIAKSELWNQVWFHGTGVPLSEHPERGEIHEDQVTCGQCQSDQVLVIAAQSCVSYHSGDRYYDCEFRCQLCGTFTALSYAEN